MVHDRRDLVNSESVLYDINTNVVDFLNIKVGVKTTIHNSMNVYFLLLYLRSLNLKEIQKWI